MEEAVRLAQTSAGVRSSPLRSSTLRGSIVHHNLPLTHTQAARKLEAAVLARDKPTIRELQRYGVTAIPEATHVHPVDRAPLPDCGSEKPAVLCDWYGDLHPNTVPGVRSLNRREIDMEIHWQEGSRKVSGHHMITQHNTAQADALNQIKQRSELGMPEQQPAAAQQDFAVPVKNKPAIEPKKHRRVRRPMGRPVEVKTWDFGRKGITDSAVSLVCSQVNGHQGAELIALLLCYNQLSHRGGMLVGNLLKSCRFVKELNLDSNSLGDRGARCVAALHN